MTDTNFFLDQVNEWAKGERHCMMVIVLNVVVVVVVVCCTRRKINNKNKRNY